MDIKSKETTTPIIKEEYIPCKLSPFIKVVFQEI